MDEKEIFDILYSKEKRDIWKKIQNIEKQIENDNELYNYFDEIKDMLSNEKSYIRMRGFRIICKLSKWDTNNKINNIIDELLQVLNEEKPTIIRMCLKELDKLIVYKPELLPKIKLKLESINLLKYKDSMQSLLKKDIYNILKNI